ncbi:MAG: V-type ATP synthase subunit A, partial [Chlamydiota bacterium]
LRDMILFLKSELYEFCYLQQNAFDKEDAYCPLNRQIPLFKLIDKVFSAEYAFDNHDEARGFFLELQGMIRNMNSLQFHSDRYKHLFAQIEEKIQHVSKHR